MSNGSAMNVFSLFRYIRPSALRSPFALPIRTFSSTSIHLAKALPPRPKPPPESEIEEAYVKGSGPGGQKIVRVAVQGKRRSPGISF